MDNKLSGVKLTCEVAWFKDPEYPSLAFLRIKGDYIPKSDVQVTEWSKAKFQLIPETIHVPQQVAKLDEAITKTYADAHEAVLRLQARRADLLCLTQDSAPPPSNPPEVDSFVDTDPQL